jgi:outer membrane protein OmpA-like peptidoglycan-associated protein
MSTRRIASALSLVTSLLSATMTVGEAQSAPGPWDAETERAAEGAVARLGARRALDIRPSVLTIEKEETAVGGGASAVIANVQQVQQAMNDLGAKETALEVRVELPADVLFDFDKADIRPDASRALGQLATIIRAYPKGRVLLEGHTDSIGKAAYNKQLSERRADAVKRWLIESGGIEAKRLSTNGLGASRPVASNATNEGRQRNRRVEAVISKRP